MTKRGCRLAVLSLLMVLLVAGTSAADRKDTYSLDIEAQPLAGALKTLADQTGLQVVFFSEIADGLSSDQIQGMFTAGEALDRLLIDTDLTYEFLGDDAIEVRPIENGVAGSPTTDEDTGVEGTQGAPEASEELQGAPETDPQEPAASAEEETAAAQAAPEPEPSAAPSEAQTDAAQPPTRFTGDITVTASRRDINVRELPSNVSVVEGVDLEAKGAAYLEDFIMQAPGVQYNKTEPQVSPMSIRGIGMIGLQQTNQLPVGTYIDEIPFTDYGGWFSSPDMSPFDLERVEVLRGPQGTLYGAASLGGALRYITNKPNVDRHEGALHLTASSTADGGTNYLTQGMFNAVVAENRFAIRGVVSYNSNGGYSDNLLTGQENWNSWDQLNGRIMLGWTPSDRLRIDVSYLHQNTKSDGSSGVTDPPGFDEPGYGFPGLPAHEDETMYDLGNLSIEWDLGFATFVSSTSVANKDLVRGPTDTSPLYAYDNATLLEVVLLGIGIPINIGDLSSQLTQTIYVFDYDSEGWTQEFRLVSRDTGTFDWLVGAFYTDGSVFAFWDQRQTGAEDAINDLIPGFGLGTILVPDDQMIYLSRTVDYREMAFYGELGIDLAPRWNLRLGGRYFDYTGDYSGTEGLIAPPAPYPLVEIDTNDFMPKVSLSFRPSDDHLVYALASRGYRVGGVNLGALLFEGVPQTFDTDRLWNYEAGFKSTWAGGRLITDVTMFYLDWTDIQLEAYYVFPEVNFRVPATINTSAAHSLGVEASLRAQLTGGLFFSTAVAWTQAELDEPTPVLEHPETREPVVVPAGTRLPMTPEWQITSSLEYFWNNPSLGFPYVSLTHRHKGEVLDYIITRVPIPAFDLFDLRIGASLGKGFDASIFARNLLDERAAVQRYPASPGNFVPFHAPESWFLNTPRTIGFTIQKKF